MNRFLRSPSFPVALLLALGPAVAVAQFRTMAPAVTVALLCTVLAHWRRTGRLPWPRPGALLGLALTPLALGLVSVAWSLEPSRGATTALSLGGLVLLGAGAARALAEDAPEHRARIGQALALGLAVGIALLAFDHATQNLFRRAVRGFPQWQVTLGFGLKPAVSVLALLLPLVLAVPGLPRPAKGALVAAGLAVALWLPGESAKIAALAGLAATALSAVLPRLVRGVAAAGIGFAMLAAPLLVGIALARAPDLSPLPPSAQHRVLIWDFATLRIAEKPVFGWGMESARAIPGGTDRFSIATLEHFGLTSPEERAWFAMPSAQRLPLHTHNAGLQAWLELGLLGAAAAAALAAAMLLAAGRLGPPALGAAVAATVTAQLSFGIWQPWWIASLVLAAVVAPALRQGRN